MWDTEPAIVFQDRRRPWNKRRGQGKLSHRSKNDSFLVVFKDLRSIVYHSLLLIFMMMRLRTSIKLNRSKWLSCLVSSSSSVSTSSTSGRGLKIESSIAVLCVVVVVVVVVAEGGSRGAEEEWMKKWTGDKWEVLGVRAPTEKRVVERQHMKGKKQSQILISWSAAYIWIKL